MMKYPKEYLNEIRLRLKVSQVVGKYVNLKKRGKEFIGLSPFKNEKTPSFTINDEKGFYHCFSTGEHGNIFDFLMKTKSFSFGEAVKSLAHEAGMPIYKFSTYDTKKEKRFEVYKKILKDYSFEAIANLFNKENSEILNYLLKRGLKKNIIEEFEVGYVESKSSLFQKFSSKYETNDLLASGLFNQSEKNKNIFERFKSRITFPIKNLSNDTIAFGGRVLDSSKFAKYINSPETEFYKKGRVLFNLNKAKDFRHKNNEVIIVEGYMDVLSLSNHGVKNVISNSGTALTDGQIDLIWKFFSDPNICLDGDQSGKSAALRIAEKLIPSISENKKIYFTTLPGGYDPDDFINKTGRESFTKFTKNKKIISDFIWESYFNELNSFDPMSLTNFEKKVRNVFQTIKDSTVKKYVIEEFINKIKDLTPNQKNYNYQRFKKRNTKVLRETSQIFKKKNEFSKTHLTEFSLLYLMLNYPDVVKRHIEILEEINLSEENNTLKSEIINLLLNNQVEDGNFDEVHKISLKKINDNCVIKNIAQNKKPEVVTEMIFDLIGEIKKIQKLEKLEKRETELMENFNENSYNEFLKLKNQLNSD